MEKILKKKVKKLKEKVNYKFNYFKLFYFKSCYLIKKLKVWILTTLKEKCILAVKVRTTVYF